MRSPRKLRIMVIARGHVGDMVGALPALRDLRTGFRDADITVVANEYVRGALEHCPYVDRVIYGFAYSPRSRSRAIASRLGLVLRIAARYDVALCLRMSPRSAPLLSLISGARKRVGYQQRGFVGRLLTHDLGKEPRYQANRVTNLAVIQSLGLEGSPQLPSLDWVPEAERQNADRLLCENRLAPDDRFAVFQIASHWGCYEWRSDKWAALANHLADQHDLRVVIVGTNDGFEHRKYAEVAELSRVPISLQGRTTLPMLFHIVSKSSLVVAADSALTQIALAQRVPSVILFGIEPQIRNGPLPEEAGSLMEGVQHWEGDGRAPAPNPHCLFGQSHCHTSNCRENKSFERIEVDEVCVRADRLLRRALRPTVSAGGRQ